MAASRLEFQGSSEHQELLAEYGRVDIALDPFPYGGGLTTCEALWMGVPVITCPGETFASRHSFSHLSNVGLTETIARDPERTSSWPLPGPRTCRDWPRCRAGLRQRVAASPLCDGKRFADHLAQVLRGAWRQRLRRAARPNRRLASAAWGLEVNSREKIRATIVIRIRRRFEFDGK